MARPAGIEPTTKNLEVSLNILLTQYNFIKFTNFLVIYILTKNQFYFHLRPFRGAKLEQKLLLDLHYWTWKTQGVEQQELLLSVNKCCERQKNGLNARFFFLHEVNFLQWKPPFHSPLALFWWGRERERKNFKEWSIFFLSFTLFRSQVSVGRVHFPEAPLRKECKGESEVERLYAAAQKRCFVKNSEE